eukprot:COSAG04_NODE_19223_length_421_cov_1.027950_1_plen_113_part_10
MSRRCRAPSWCAFELVRVQLCCHLLRARVLADVRTRGSVRLGGVRGLDMNHLRVVKLEVWIRIRSLCTALTPLVRLVLQSMMAWDAMGMGGDQPEEQLEEEEEEEQQQQQQQQ